jgi:hypothetical protein
MTTEEQSMENKPKKEHKIEVRVTFPISAAGPFHEKVEPETTAGTVKASAMGHFGVAEDGQHSYYLSHAGVQVPDTEAIGNLAGAELKLTLIKELIQG